MISAIPSGILKRVWAMRDDPGPRPDILTIRPLPRPGSSHPRPMPDGATAVPQGMLQTSVAAGESGPVIMLSGEADLTTVPQLSALITAQLPAGAQQLTIDVSELRFADSATIQALLRAARTLKERGGNLVLHHPLQQMTRLLTLMGTDQMFIIRGQTHGAPESEGKAG